MSNGFSSRGSERYSEYASGIAKTVSNPKDGVGRAAEAIYGSERGQGGEREIIRREPEVAVELLNEKNK